MNEEFVRKVLEQAATGGVMDMHNINDIWRVYKEHTKDTHPDVSAFIENNEAVARKMFLSTISVFLAVPSFLIHSGVPKESAALSMFTLEKSMQKEYREILKAEGKL